MGVCVRVCVCVCAHVGASTCMCGCWWVWGLIIWFVFEPIKVRKLISIHVMIRVQYLICEHHFQLGLIVLDTSYPLVQVYSGKLDFRNTIT